MATAEAVGEVTLRLSDFVFEPGAKPLQKR